MGAPFMPWVPQFFDDDGAPLAGGFIYFFTAGTTTPEDTFSQSDLDPLSANTNPIVLDADGRPPDPIFWSPVAYKIRGEDATHVQLWEYDNVSDPGWIFSQTYGTQQVAGSSAMQTTGYQVLSTDRLVLMDTSSGASTVLLPAAADYSAMLVIKNMSTNTLAVTPAGADTVEGIAGAYSLPASATPKFTTVQLISDGVSAWSMIARFNGT